MDINISNSADLTSSQTPASWDSLPNEMLAHIMENLSGEELATMELVDRTSYSIIEGIQELKTKQEEHLACKKAEKERESIVNSNMPELDKNEFLQDLSNEHIKISLQEGIKTALLTHDRKDRVGRFVQEKARTNPQEALEAIQIIQDPELKNFLFLKIVSAQAKVDFKGAIQIASSMTDPDTKSRAYGVLLLTAKDSSEEDLVHIAIVEGQRKVNPLMALHKANLISNPTIRHEIYSSIVPMIAESGMEKAMEAIYYIRNPLDKDNAYSFLASQQARKKDVQNALTAANSIQNPAMRENAYQWVEWAKREA